MSSRVVNRPMRNMVRPSRMHRYVRMYGGKIVKGYEDYQFIIALKNVDGEIIAKGPALVDDVIVFDKNGRARFYTEDGIFVNPGRPDKDEKLRQPSIFDRFPNRSSQNV